MYPLRQRGDLAAQGRHRLLKDPTTSGSGSRRRRGQAANLQSRSEGPVTRGASERAGRLAPWNAAAVSRTVLVRSLNAEVGGAVAFVIAAHPAARRLQAHEAAGGCRDPDRAPPSLAWAMDTIPAATAAACPARRSAIPSDRVPRIAGCPSQQRFSRGGEAELRSVERPIEIIPVSSITPRRPSPAPHNRAGLRSLV